MAIATGHLVTEKWEKDGETRTSLVLVCDSLRFVALQNGSSAGTREEEESTVLKNGGEGKPPF
jgi:single-stranded DNA-binding protein